MSRAYYNENDSGKAAWLRELIKAGVIAPGEVDERNIEQVEPEDLEGFTQCHFFAGIGVWSYALRLAGWPDDRAAWTGSCPCPSFSAAGKGQGFDDPRHLWPHWYRLIRERKPPVVFGEQADDAIGYGWLDLVQAQLEAEAYAVGPVVLGACSVGGSDMRQRLYFVADRLAVSVRSERRQIVQHGTDGCDGKDGGRPEAHRKPGARGQVHRLGRREKLFLETGCTVGDLADAAIPRREEERQYRVGPPPLPARSAKRSRDDRMGFSDSAGSQPRIKGSQAVGHGSTAESTGSSQRMADSHSGRQPVHGAASGEAGHIERGGEGERMEESRQQRPRRGLFGPGEGSGSNGSGPPSEPERPGYVNGFWANADWVLRRKGNGEGAEWCPVEPRTFPLAHGVANRVLKLRGYGDAINAQVAKAFIEAYIEARSEAILCPTASGDIRR